MKFYWLIFTCLAFSSLISQTFKKDTTLYEYPDYINSFAISPTGKYIGLSVGSEKTVILDSSFQPLKEFAYDFMWGGGGVSFSFDDKHLAYLEYGKSSKVNIYDFARGKTQSIKIESTDINFFHHSSKLLISWNGHFNLYDLEKGKLQKDIINVGQTKTWFYSGCCLDEKDENLYVTTSKNTIEVFSTVNWHKLNSYGPFEGEIENLRLFEDQLIFNIGQEVFVYNMKSEKTNRVKIDLEYISDLSLDTKNGLVYIAGTGSHVFAMDIKTMKTGAGILELDDAKCFGLLYLGRNRLIIGDNMKLVLYSGK